MNFKKALGLLLVLAVSFSLANCANQNKKLGLNKVHFDYDKDAIRGDMVAVMDRNVAFLKKSERHFSTKAYRHGRKGGNVNVAGHCDERGSNEYNYALGARRAESAKSYSVTHGISASRLRTVSYGEDRPACKASNESCWYQNRRAEFSVE